MSLNIFIGNEVYFKSKAINDCISSITNEIDILTLDVDGQGKVDSYLLDMNSHLMSYDFFGKTKVGIVRTSSSAKAINFIDYFLKVDLADSVLIVDLQTKDDKQVTEFKKKNTIKNLPKSIVVEYFLSLKNYEEDKLTPFIEEKLKEFDIKFTSDEDYKKSVEYIVKNSKLSYSCAYNELKKLEFLNHYTFDYKRTVNTISDNICTDRYYVLDRLIESSHRQEIFEILNTYLPKFKKKDLEAILTDISTLVKDYIVFMNTGKCCIQKSNYYKFKKLKFRIVEPKDFLIKINNLLKEARKGNPAVGDYLFLHIFEYFEFGC